MFCPTLITTEKLHLLESHEQRPNLSHRRLEASHGTGMDGGGGQIRSGDFLSRCIQGIIRMDPTEDFFGP